MIARPSTDPFRAGSDVERPGRQRVVYGRSERPAVRVLVAGEWVFAEVLHKALDGGTWWARVAYVDPLTYEIVQELLPADTLLPGG